MEKKETSESLYSTRDLAKASAIALRIPVVEIDKTNPSRAEFIFEQNEKARIIERDYDCGKLRVEPRQYYDQIRALKARLYA